MPFHNGGSEMREKTLNVMKKHLNIVEKYIDDLDKAVDKKQCMDAMNNCTKKVKELYEELEEVAADFKSRLAGSDTEIQAVSAEIGDLLSKKIIEFYPKTGTYLADPEYQKAQTELDSAISNSPLFGDNSHDEQMAMEVSKSFASTMDKMAVQLEAETSASDEDFVADTIEKMEVFKAYSERYVANLESANTARKMVTATDKFVDSIKKLIAEMNQDAHAIRVLMTKKDRPEKIDELGNDLKKILGEDLSAVIKGKEELLNDHKVKKSVGKLAPLLQQIPF
jgi:molecular chaperone DnaK (HSP70)